MKFIVLTLITIPLFMGVNGCSNEEPDPFSNCSDLIRDMPNVREAVERSCDRLDNDCDGLIDEGLRCDASSGGISTMSTYDQGGMSVPSAGQMNDENSEVVTGGVAPLDTQSCDALCGSFADCAVSACDAYVANDQPFLINRCLAECTP